MLVRRDVNWGSDIVKDVGIFKILSLTFDPSFEEFLIELLIYREYKEQGREVTKTTS